jgi:hypothetical protein
VISADFNKAGRYKLFKTKQEIEAELAKKDVYGPVFLSESGEYFFYFGFKPIEQHGDMDFLPLMGRLPPKDEKDERRFMRVKRGALYWETFLNDFGKFEHLENHRASMPKKTNMFFGIKKQPHELDEEATRQIFGATFEELENFIAAYDRVLRPDVSDYFRMRGMAASITVSSGGGERSNDCDVTSCLIPQGFPYISLAPSECVWSHVSLYGFLSHIDLLCQGSRNNVFYSAMLNEGIEASLLDDLSERLFEVASPAHKRIQYRDLRDS